MVAWKPSMRTTACMVVGISLLVVLGAVRGEDETGPAQMRKQTALQQITERMIAVGHETRAGRDAARRDDDDDRDGNDSDGGDSDGGNDGGGDDSGGDDSGNDGGGDDGGNDGGNDSGENDDGNDGNDGGDNDGGNDGGDSDRGDNNGGDNDGADNDRGDNNGGDNDGADNDRGEGQDDNSADGSGSGSGDGGGDGDGGSSAGASDSADSTPDLAPATDSNPFPNFEVRTPPPTDDDSVEQTPFFVTFEFAIDTATTFEKAEWRGILQDLGYPPSSIQIDSITSSRRQSSQTSVQSTLFGEDEDKVDEMRTRLEDEGDDLLADALKVRGVDASVTIQKASPAVTLPEVDATPAPAVAGSSVQQTDFFVDFELSVVASSALTVNNEQWRKVLADAMSVGVAAVQVDRVSLKRRQQTQAQQSGVSVKGSLFASSVDGVLSLGTRMRNKGQGLIASSLAASGVAGATVTVIAAVAKTSISLAELNAIMANSPSFNYAYLAILGVLVIPMAMCVRARMAANDRQRKLNSKISSFAEGDLVTRGDTGILIPVAAPVAIPGVSNSHYGNALQASRLPAANPVMHPSAPDLPGQAHLRGGGGAPSSERIPPPSKADTPPAPADAPQPAHCAQTGLGIPNPYLFQWKHVLSPIF